MKTSLSALAALLLTASAHAQAGEPPCTPVQPRLPAVDWQGEAAYLARAEVRDGRVTAVTVTALTAGVERRAQRAMVQAINQALRDARCQPGEHVYEQRITFRTDTIAERCSGDAARSVDWTGACVDGLADGEGRLEVHDAGGKLLYRHEGRLKAGRRDGPGVTTRADGSFVEGAFMDDRLQGTGRARFANGDQFDGTWQAGLASGEGRWQFANGDQLQGQWLQGLLRHGNYRWAHGASSTGGFAASRPDGPGELQFADGAVLRAGFVRGRPDGPAQLRLPEGGVQEAQFKNGALDNTAPSFANSARSTHTMRLQRLRMPALAPMPRLDDDRQVSLACTIQAQFESRDFGWKGRAVYQATVVVRDGQVQSVDIGIKTSSGDSGVDSTYIKGLKQAVAEGTRCTGDATLRRDFVVERR